MTENKTLERIARMEQKLQDVCEDLMEIKVSLKDFIEQADSRYASKWTEKITIGLLSAAGTGVLGLFIYLVERHII